MAEPDLEAKTAENDRPWGHRWGFSDTRFALNDDGSVSLTGNRYDLAGYRMYDLLPYVEEVLDIKLDLEDRRVEIQNKPVPPSNRNERFCRELTSRLRADQISFDDKVRLLHSHGQTSASEVFKVIYSKLDRAVDLVCYPESETDCQSLIQLAKEHDVCLIPYGGGTSVSCALTPPERETRMIVSLDMRRMNKIEWVDEENLRACVQAGITGSELDRQLELQGFMSGHEPDSIELSTLGGWISTSASGMKKNRYGNIEEVVEQVTMITPAGELKHLHPVPRSSIGMQPQSLFFGSEGNLGLITQAVIKIHALPEVKKYGSLIFPNFDLGVQFLHQLAHTAFVPASIRLVDNVQFRFGQALKPRAKGLEAKIDRLKKFYVLKLRRFNPHQMAATTIVMEGSQSEVEFQESSIYALAKKFQGLPGGATNGRRGYLLTFAIAYIRDFLSDFHIVGETFETSVPWSKISPVCDAVVKKAAEQYAKLGLPGKPYVSYRVTQVYHTGVCIYFMFGFYAKGLDDPEKAFSDIEHSLRQVIIDHGGSISHHHGVGKIRKDFMKDTLSPSSIELLKDIKRSVDPKNVFGIRNNVLAE